MLRTLEAAWPSTRFTWIIGKAEHRLLSLVPNVEFISYDKRGGLRELGRLRRALAARRFELQWLFTTHRIHAALNQHVLDGLFGFADALGVHDRKLRWDIPLPETARAYAARLVPDDRPTLVISACSSHPLRNWRPEHYAAVADHAASAHGMRVILCGGPARTERTMAVAIVQGAPRALVDQVGKDTLPELLALLARADVLVAPDSGPVHMATAVGLPVIGLYAATNSARSGPYLSRGSCIDRYAAAAQCFLGKSPDAVPWTTKIERPGVMDLITPRDVTDKLDLLRRQPLRRR